MRTKNVINEFIRFGIVGVLCTLFHYGIYYLLQFYINVNIAYTLGYILSFIANFFLTSLFTFRSSPAWNKLLGMIIAHAVNYTLHIILLNVFIWLGVAKEYAPIPVFSIAIPMNFIFVRFVFKDK